MPRVQEGLQSSVAGERWPKLALSSIHQAMWKERLATMLWAVPSYSDIWLAMMADKDGTVAWFTDQIETAATDDKFVYINPEFYFKLTVDEALFVNSHEVGHASLNHAGLIYMTSLEGCVRYEDGTVLPYIADMMQQAADYVLNDQLVEARIGKMPECALHWPELITGFDSLYEAYRKLYKHGQGGGGGGGGKPGDKQGKDGGQSGGQLAPDSKTPAPRTTDGQPGSPSKLGGKPFDQVLKPGQGRGKSPTKAMGERKQVEWDTAIQAAMESAKARGQLPANLERIFSKRLQPKADWRDLYMLAVSRKIGNGRYTWSRLEPQLAYRKIGAPGRMQYGCELVVIAVDTSGSINQRTLDVFMAETVALLEQAKPRRIIFVQCDMHIHEWADIDATEDLLSKKLKGGGGTMFEPVFARITKDNEAPDMLVYLTDGMGSFPAKAPSYPVIWGNVKIPGYEEYQKYPWGEVVDIPPQAEAA